ncbi:MAG TPA: glycosyltransferase [Fimbriimonadaceae bacterium]|nr:glycosyltransferase [Fimbriimonadaceae bacterium]
MSVVIPCFNQAHFLRDAIASCLEQDHAEKEVVVVDDGSTDDTAEVARSYGARVRLVQQPNTGLSGARNAGIRHASGELVCLLDADDTLLAGVLGRRAAMFERDPEVGLVAGAFEVVDSELRVLRVHGTDLKAPPDPQHRHAPRRNLAVTCGCLVRRRAYELCGDYDPLLNACEDWDHYIRVSRRFRIAYDPVPGARYRQIRGSMSRDYLRMFDAARAVMRKNRPFAASRVHFGWDSFVGLLTHTRGNTVAKLLEENSRVRAMRQLALLCVERPSMSPYLAALGLNAVWNRVLWLAGSGPLRQRPTSLS